MSFHVPNQFRFREKNHPYGSDDSQGNNGAFMIPYQTNVLRIMASDQHGWEHVSVSLQNRCPNWKEMCFVKELFWDDQDTVVQFHPKKSEYINQHENTLHMWRCINNLFPTPPRILVGISDEKEEPKDNKV